MTQRGEDSTITAMSTYTGSHNNHISDREAEPKKKEKMVPVRCYKAKLSGFVLYVSSFSSPKSPFHAPLYPHLRGASSCSPDMRGPWGEGAFTGEDQERELDGE